MEIYQCGAYNQSLHRYTCWQSWTCKSVNLDLIIEAHTDVHAGQSWICKSINLAIIIEVSVT